MRTRFPYMNTFAMWTGLPLLDFLSFMDIISLAWTWLDLSDWHRYMNMIGIVWLTWTYGDMFDLIWLSDIRKTWLIWLTDAYVDMTWLIYLTEMFWTWLTLCYGYRLMDREWWTWMTGIYGLELLTFWQGPKKTEHNGQE